MEADGTDRPEATCKQCYICSRSCVARRTTYVTRKMPRRCRSIYSQAALAWSSPQRSALPHQLIRTRLFVSGTRMRCVCVLPSIGHELCAVAWAHGSDWSKRGRTTDTPLDPPRGCRAPPLVWITGGVGGSLPRGMSSVFFYPLLATEREKAAASYSYSLERSAFSPPLGGENKATNGTMETK